MFLKDVSLVNFRNHKKTKILFSKTINIIYGDNGAGKTNILEGIYVLSFFKSFRQTSFDNLINSSNEVAKLKGNLKNNLTYTLEVGFDKNQKLLKVDGEKINKMSDYIDKVNIIVFHTEDLELIRGVPGVRRKYLNNQLSQLSINYYNVINQFNKLLKIRNDFLKKISNNEKIDMNYFDILTDYFVEKSVFIYRMRKEYIDRVNKYCEFIFESLSGLRGFNIKYEPSIELKSFDKDEVKSVLRQKLDDEFEREVRFKTTLFGPHRDDFIFCLKDENLRFIGSQGQCRMSVLSLKLSEIEIFKDFKGTSPIILLDDVFSELDKEKKNNLLKFIDNGMQVIITTTDLNSISKKIIKKSKIIKIVNGSVER